MYMQLERNSHELLDLYYCFSTHVEFVMKFEEPQQTNPTKEAAKTKPNSIRIKCFQQPQAPLKHKKGNKKESLKGGDIVFKLINQ